MDQKVEVKAQSKIGSTANIKHKPGGGDKKVVHAQSIPHPGDSSYISLCVCVCVCVCVCMCVRVCLIHNVEYVYI